jgi:hypothetical protein
MTPKKFLSILSAVFFLGAPLALGGENTKAGSDPNANPPVDSATKPSDSTANPTTKRERRRKTKSAPETPKPAQTPAESGPSSGGGW